MRQRCSWGRWCLATVAAGPRAMSPGPPALSQQATSHPSLQGCGMHAAERAASKAADPPLIPDMTARTQRTPAHPHFQTGRGVPGEAEGFCTLEPVPRHSGAWKGHRGRCSDGAASSVLGGRAICRAGCLVYTSYFWKSLD